ncbi:putative elongation factor 1-gamma (EF-1-gamma) [Trypanosoma cruzi]|nr:putative elongation factor 1-gamma (EF-1-gamma) [Trypanosoma cruzi]
MQCVTANLICVWLRRMEHVRQYALGVALMIVEEGRHEIVALCVLCGRGMPAIVRDVEDAELFDWGEVADVAAQRERMTDCLCWRGAC